jgi:hypothetical protein
MFIKIMLNMFCLSVKDLPAHFVSFLMFTWNPLVSTFCKNDSG